MTRTPATIGQRTYECTCPDFARFSGRNVALSAFSSTIDRDFTGTDTGTRFVCKHIYATLRFRGELTQDLVPTDVPVEEGYKFKREKQFGVIGEQSSRFAFDKIRQIKYEDLSKRPR